MKKRRRIKQTKPLEERLTEEVKRLRDAAKSLPLGAKRQELIHKVRQAEIGVRITKWLLGSGK